MVSVNVRGCKIVIQTVPVSMASEKKALDVRRVQTTIDTTSEYSANPIHFSIFCVVEIFIKKMVSKTYIFLI